MPIFLIPILILIGIFAVTAGGDIVQDLDLPFSNFRLFPERAEQITAVPQKTSIRRVQPGPAPSSFLLDTLITKGPQHGAVLSNTTKATFEFSGSVLPKDTEGRIAFQTKIEGLEDKWQITSGTKRTITLPAGPKEYTFLVRSYLDNSVDLTPASRTFSVNVSPYFGKVHIAGLQTASRSSPSFITITGKLSSVETVNLTGWTVKGRAGSYKIPYASKTVTAGLSLNPVHQVQLQRSGRVLLSSGRGPFGLQSNFQPNKCMAYLRPSIPFPLEVPSSCSVVKPTEAQLLFFSLVCQNYILDEISYSACTPPTLTGVNEVTLDRQCTGYLDGLFEEFTYQGCLTRSESDSDFLKNEWHLYMNADLLNQRADAIKLLDQNGLLVDRETY